MIPRVVLVDDHDLFRQAMRALLGTRTDIELVGEFPDGRSAIEGVPALNPDVVLIDVCMTGLNGIETASRLVREKPSLKVLMLSGYADQQYLRDALRAGVRGYMTKHCDVDELALAVRLVHGGNSYFSPELVEHYDVGELIFEARNPIAGNSAARLTPREREIVQLFVEGRTAVEIARLLCLTPKTVEGHRTCVYLKLRVRSRAELVRMALVHGLVPDEAVELTAAGGNWPGRRPAQFHGAFEPEEALAASA